MGGVWALFGAMAPCVTRRLAGGGLAWVDVMGNKWGRQKKSPKPKSKNNCGLARAYFVREEKQYYARMKPPLLSKPSRSSRSENGLNKKGLYSGFIYFYETPLT